MANRFSGCATQSDSNRYRQGNLNAYSPDALACGGKPMDKSEFYPSQTNLVLFADPCLAGKLDWPVQEIQIKSLKLVYTR